MSIIDAPFPGAALALGLPGYEPDVRAHPGANGETRNVLPIREVLRKVLSLALGLDTSTENPIKSLVSPGARIAIKPNIVTHETDGLVGARCLMTDGAVVGPLVEMALDAVGPHGNVVICDTSLQSADFTLACKQTGVAQLVARLQEGGASNLSLVDLRAFESRQEVDGYVGGRRPLPGDPLGTTIVDLGWQSALEGITQYADRFRVDNYDPRQSGTHHAPGRHQYLIPNSILHCDLFINVPKLKTHRKAGMTGALKNLVGIQVNKDWIPHFRSGTPEEGGDEALSMDLATRVWRSVRTRMQGGPRWAWTWAQRAWWVMKRPLKKVGWDQAAGFRVPTINDTLWRPVADLNAILLHASNRGRTDESATRRYLCVVDAIVAGEGEGPLRPEPLPLGCLIAGTDPVLIDVVGCQLMGLRWRLLPSIARLLEPRKLPITNLSFTDIDATKVPCVDGRAIRVVDIPAVARARVAEGWEAIGDHDRITPIG